MNLFKHTVWAVTIMVLIGVIAIETRRYNIEEIQQRSFMMKACVDAGGQWERDSVWAPGYRCIRPGART